MSVRVAVNWHGFAAASPSYGRRRGDGRLCVDWEQRASARSNWPRRPAALVHHESPPSPVLDLAVRDHERPQPHVAVVREELRDPGGDRFVVAGADDVGGAVEVGLQDLAGAHDGAAGLQEQRGLGEHALAVGEVVVDGDVGQGTDVSWDVFADIDGNGILQIWGYSKPDPSGGLTTGGLGCDPSLLPAEEIGPCTVGSTTF